jgi:hypothetical protein
MGYPDFMKIVSCIYLVKNERELCNVPPSTTSIESSSTASSLLKRPDILVPKRAPAKDTSFWLDGKRQDHIFLKFSTVRTGTSPARRYRVCFKKQKD